MGAAKQPVRIITLSREFGAGGADIAQRLGSALGWRVIDHALIAEVARRFETAEAEVEALDEHVGGIVERIGAVFALGSPEAPVLGEMPHPDAVAAVERAVLQDAVSDLPFVVVGHGAQCIFRDRADALHVRISAPREARIRCVARRKGLDAHAAARETERHDAERRRYIHHHFGCDANDPALYHLQLNTGFLSLQQATALILQVVAWRETPQPAPVVVG